MSNYFSINRKLFEHKLWLSEPFTRAQAWIDLLGLANFKDGTVFIRSVEVEVKRGQVARSERWLAERWQWSRKKVDTFLKWLERERQIEPQKTNVTTLITIRNYDRYQATEPQKNHKSTAEEPLNNNVNNNKYIKSKHIEDNASASYPPKNTNYSQPPGALDTFKDEGKYTEFIKAILQERDEFKMVGYSQLIDQRIVFLNLANRQTIGNPESYFRQWIIGRLEDGKLEVRNLVPKRRGN